MVAHRTAFLVISLVHRSREAVTRLKANLRQIVRDLTRARSNARLLRAIFPHSAEIQSTNRDNFRFITDGISFSTLSRFSVELSKTEVQPSQENQDHLVAIVMQGPVVEDFEFTKKTLEGYRRRFPNSNIILSTWDDTNERFLDGLIDFDVTTILQDKASIFPGVGNFNLQLMSTRAGIKKACQLGCQYILKTRADQRFYSPNALTDLVRLVRMFPPLDAPDQDARLVACGLGSFRDRPYGVTDMFQFSSAAVIDRVWNAPFEQRSDSPEQWQNHLQWAESRFSEVRLIANFLESSGEVLDFSLSQYWDCLRRRFMIIDSHHVQLFWPKYSVEREHFSRFAGRFREFSFVDWLTLLGDSPQVPNEADRLR